MLYRVSKIVLSWLHELGFSMLPNKFMQPGKHNFEDLSGIRVHKVVHKILLMTDEWDWIDEVAQADLGRG